MKTADIREAFLSYFERQGHTRVDSSSLVPHDDPTLLFTNAGMNQFKDTFLGLEVRDYNRAVSSQRCVRAGGKHNDLENVGYTARHHTFFEMLGNFSFGDYFKREAINFAWTFLTEELQLPKDKLWVTVHISDDEAAQIWVDEIGVDPNRLSRLDEDNFWQMGDTGPCGPSSEIFYDHGPDVPGGPPGSPDDDLDRYIEIWNLVFMQYNRDSAGVLNPLPAPSVDTGMGLERISAVLQGEHNNYDIDLFKALIAAAAEKLDVEDHSHTSLRVVADHLRSCAFLITDGVLPSNEGRGYVLRRILRRAIRHGNKLGATEPFFASLVPALVSEMGTAYPELVRQEGAIIKALASEEEQFARTLDKGMDILEQALASLDGNQIPGDVVFRLYDTFGFPVDLTNDIARERGLELDIEGYEAEMQAQRKRSQESGSFQVDYNNVINVAGETEFLGYGDVESTAKVRGLFVDGDARTAISAGDSAVVILDRTPFYGESGGQVGDTGYIVSDSAKLEVRDTTKAQGHHLHHVVVIEGELASGDEVKAAIDASLRTRIKANHSATHLMHEALRQVLGEHVQQKGSLVDADKLRFDFSHSEGLTAQELQQVASIVNQQVQSNGEVLTQEMDMESAVAAGATALFGEKYGDEVRVLTMGTDRFSVELCGGTHVSRTGDIGIFRILTEAGVASGVRRIEAVTGVGALADIAKADQALAEVCDVVKASPALAAEKVSNLRKEVRDLEKQITQLKQKLATGAGSDLTEEAVQVGDTNVLATVVDGADASTLRQTLDHCKNKLSSGVVLLAAVEGDKISLVAGVTKDLTDRVRAGDVMKEFAGRVGGKGGGRPDMAQGGGTDVSALKPALADLPEWVSERLGG
ncbi:alanine--tRNA ligase [Candidatus Paraluminiphilus aquimaris]|uniref:Alanine--tRNA ligase n=1 Tax=Candidatus Paraluminiphilus aquimaris TaxID=2518994 RepID=A0ABY6QAU7_9GAMM|nr:alanine--tRNA ligase [Candidatus Paraluminiphilus aquimaris]UZP75333.1 alanine--tRNA ligase [Candidatus Paraluminiphilus aquimaris]